MFNIEVDVKTIHIGPIVIKFEISIKNNIKVNKIINLENNIKLALAAHQIRIEAPIPGKSTVGIEIDHPYRAAVNLRSTIEGIVNKTHKLQHSLLTPIGKNVTGDSIIIDLKKMPHLLIAGATGSGKSVCLNAIITSLMMLYSPHHLRLLLIDPKKIEFAFYSDIPHLLAPIVTDSRKAAAVLKQVVAEMDRRYELFTHLKARNIQEYNNQLKPSEQLPYILVIIDELADLMIIAAKEVEQSIMRLTQLARACGIHLILATQRPSTDVITGVIKANIPARIAFAVSSSIDSRTILDHGGAEKLLGAGDMLYQPPSYNALQRIQGILVTDKEIKQVCKTTSRQLSQKFDDDFLNLKNVDKNSNSNSSSDDADELYDEAKAYVIQSQKASASWLQRRFSIGYNRAARIIDQLEEDGIIGPPTGSSKPRDVLV